MPRFRLTGITNDQFDNNTGIDNTEIDDTEIDDLHDAVHDRRTPRRRRRSSDQGPRVVAQGKSGRSVVEIDAPVGDLAGAPSADREFADGSAYSSYDVATRGPGPVPDWLVTSASALDTGLGTIKSGKEADVTLLDRSLPGGPGCLIAVKTFRSADHRLFHRDAGYLEGRRVRRSRETRAMAARTGFGRELLAGQWAASEFAALSSMWKAGARVPYPVQLIGSEVMMEFIGGPDGSAAPRLAAYDTDTAAFTELWHDLVASLEVLAESGLTHGDLSPYNVLVDDQGCVLIDLPQVVDLVANPQAAEFLDRDCRNIADFFARRGVLAADAETLALHLSGLAIP